MDEIVKTIINMSGRYNYHMIFQDWVEAMALSIQNSCYLIHDKCWESREQMYKNIMEKYTLEERQNFSKMLVMLTEEFEKSGPSDILGEIYMSQKSGNSNLGQFFTPFHLSEMMAQTALENILKEYDGRNIEINEPSAGGGGLLIAAIKILKEKGINYQRKLNIIAQDLDWNGVYMTYVQLSLLGAQATVIQGDTLREPYIRGKTPEERVFYTPMKMGVLL